MGTPYHISECTSPFHAPDKASAEFQAVSLIAKSLAHPQRALLSVFVQQADDRELAARFFLKEVVGQNKTSIEQFLADWISLLRKVRPIVCEDVDASLLLSIWQRDDGRSCILRTSEEKKHDEDPLLIHVLPPTLLHSPDMSQDGRLYKMLALYIGQSKLNLLELILDPSSTTYDPSEQLMLLSSETFEHFANGRLSLKAIRLGSTSASARYCVEEIPLIPSVRFDILPLIKLDNRAADSSSLPNPLLYEVHRQFAPALAWLEVAGYMRQSCSPSGSSTSPSHTSPAARTAVKRRYAQQCTHFLCSVFQFLWLQVPVSLRAAVYEGLASLGPRFYGRTSSDRTYRLPFNLYLRKTGEGWAPKHQAELRSLQMVNKYTHIPAPQGVDTIQHGGSSYLLMTGLPGCGLGSMLSIMTDEQVEAAAQDLRDYLTELRQIPNNTGSPYRICNALGGGILDWRIGDSERREMRFHDETEFNQSLTSDLLLDEDARQRIAKSHSVEHDIVFTHADLNLRNILVDDTGRISGIVDWECAGWYPEYWEYSKMHFTVRQTSRWIVDVVDRIFPAYRDELEAENILVPMKPSW